MELAQRRIESFDFTLDTLTNKIELARAEKNRLEEQYVNQINQIQENNSSELQQLSQSLQESLTAQRTLKKSFDEKIETINELTAQLESHKARIENQTKEMQSFTEKLKSAQAVADNEKSQNIFLKGELYKSRQAAREVANDLAEFESEFEEAVKSEAQIKEMVNHLKTMAAIKEIEINALMESFSKSKKEMDADVQDLVFMIEWEKKQRQNFTLPASRNRRELCY